jgi:hypothetical protein
MTGDSYEYEFIFIFLIKIQGKGCEGCLKKPFLICLPGKGKGLSRQHWMNSLHILFIRPG